MGSSSAPTWKRSTSALGVRIGLRVDDGVGMAVAAEEGGEPQDVALAVAPDDDRRPAGAGLQEADAAQDQRAHDALAELGFLDQEIAQALRPDDDRRDGGERRGVDQRRLAGKLRQLAHEIAGPVGDDELLMAQCVALP